MKFINFKNDYTLVKTDKIDMILFQFLFPVDILVEDIPYISILKNIICDTSEKYSQNSEYNIVRIKKGVTNINLSRISIGFTKFIKYAFEVPREGLIKDYNIDDAFSFAIDSLMKPYIVDSKFDQKRFDYEKEYLIRCNKIDDDNISSSNSRKLWDIIDKNEIIDLSTENYTKSLYKLNNEEMYDFYLKNLHNNKPIIYVYGNIEKKVLDRLFSKYYPLTKEEIKVKKDYMQLLPVIENENIEIQTKFNQTQLFMIYQTEVNEENNYKLSLLKDFLSSRENNLIFKTLREKNNLVYQCGAHIRSNSGLLIIEALIQDKNVDKAIELVKEVFESLKDKNVLSECLNKTKKFIDYDLLKDEDDLYNDIYEKVDNDLELKHLKIIAKLYKNISVEEELEFIKNVKHTSTIIFRGVKNDKDNN